MNVVEPQATIKTSSGLDDVRQGHVYGHSSASIHSASSYILHTFERKPVKTWVGRASHKDTPKANTAELCCTVADLRTYGGIVVRSSQ